MYVKLFGCCFIYSLFYCFDLSSFLFFISNVYYVCTFIINFLLIVSLWVYVKIYLINLLSILLIFQYSIFFNFFNFKLYLISRNRFSIIYKESKRRWVNYNDIEQCWDLLATFGQIFYLTPTVPLLPLAP